MLISVKVECINQLRRANTQSIRQRAIVETQPRILVAPLYIKSTPKLLGDVRCKVFRLIHE